VAPLIPQDRAQRPRTSHSTVWPLRRSCLQVHGLRCFSVALEHLWGRSVSFRGFEVGCAKVLEFGVDELQSRGGSTLSGGHSISAEIIQTLPDT
jgi:hypothetical protein